MEDGSSVEDGHLGHPRQREMSAVSALSSEESLVQENEGGERARIGSAGGEVRCRRCGEERFRAREVGSGGGVRMECARCGMMAGV